MSNLQVYDQYDFNGKRDLIIDYAGRGFSIAYIAKIVGMAESTVSRLMKAEYKERCKNREEIILAQSQTLQWLKLKITSRIHQAGDKWARQDAELLLKLMERQAKLHGLDEAATHKVNVIVEELSDEDIMSRLRAEGIEIKQLAPAQVQSKETQTEDAEFVEKMPTSEDN